jgi:hypothetical protein
MHMWLVNIPTPVMDYLMFNRVMGKGNLIWFNLA